MQKLILNTVATRAVSTALNFSIALLIARHAGPAVKGDVTLLVTTTWFLIFLSNILGGQVLVYLIPRNKIEALLMPAYVWSAITALAGLLFLKLTHLIHANHVPSIVILSLLSALISINQTVLLGRKQIISANLLQIIPLLGQVAGILFCFYFLRINDAYAYIYASLAAYFLTSIVSFMLLRNLVQLSSVKDFPAIEGLKNSFRFGFLFQLVEILQLLNLRYYFYQLGIQQGSKYLGIFSIGISILEAIWIIPRSIATIHYVQTANASDLTREAKRTVQLVKFSFVLSALALFLTWLVPSQLYVLVFGPGFSEVKHSVRFLFPGVLIYSIPLVMNSFYLGTGKYPALIISNFLGFVSLVIFSGLLIPRYVMSGAGLAATLSFAVAAITVFFFFIHDTNTSVWDFIPKIDDWTQFRKILRNGIISGTVFNPKTSD